MFAATDNLAVVARGYAAATARPVDSLARLQFWIDTLGDRSITSITADDVDLALGVLARRGRMRPVRNGKPVPTGKPLAPSSFTRYAGELAGVYKFARKERLISRSFVPPTRGLESPQSPLKTEFITQVQKEVPRVCRLPSQAPANYCLRLRNAARPDRPKPRRTSVPGSGTLPTIRPS